MEILLSPTQTEFFFRRQLMKILRSISFLCATVFLHTASSQNSSSDHHCPNTSVNFEARNETIIPVSITTFAESHVNTTYANETAHMNSTSVIRKGRFRALSNRISGLFKLRRTTAESNQPHQHSEPAFVRRR